MVDARSAAVLVRFKRKVTSAITVVASGKRYGEKRTPNGHGISAYEANAAFISVRERLYSTRMADVADVAEKNI